MIKTETRDRVLSIEIARPDKKNALTQDMYRAMSQALAAADADAQVRAILIHGTRDCFTAGNDLKDFLERPPHSGPAASFDFISGLPKVAKPLIAAVGGVAVGVGTTMLLHCDLVYAAPNARFHDRRSNHASGAKPKRRGWRADRESSSASSGRRSPCPARCRRHRRIARRGSDRR